MRSITPLALLVVLAASGLGNPVARAAAGAHHEPAPAPPRQKVPPFPAAPALSGTWLQGKPVDLATESRLVVVELWATWCEPCRDQIPHLAKLQAAHPEQMRVVGVSDESSGVVKPFLAHHAEMTYAVVADGHPMSTAFRAVAPSDPPGAIPQAYLVKGGHILWSGHPATMEPVLAAVLDGTWTPLDRFLAIHMSDLQAEYLHYVQDGPPEGAAQVAHVYRDAEWVQADDQNNLAWAILTELPPAKQDDKLALALASKAVQRTNGQDYASLDTQALALYATGQRDAAVAAEEKAIAGCHAAHGFCGSMKRQLKRFQKGVARAGTQ